MNAVHYEHIYAETRKNIKKLELYLELLAFEKIILYQYLPNHYGHCQISSSWIYKTSQDTNHLSPNSPRKVLLKLKRQ